jgi:FKBP-type peptidyl-prolyl cis-trans isomerase FkpA
MRFLIPVLIATLSFSSCVKDTCAIPTTKAPASEISQLEQYLLSAMVSTAVKDERGFYYIISSMGTGTRPNLCSTVRVSYTGRLTNGSVFDQSASATFSLSGLITGWQEGIPLIQKGGAIRLYLPPSLAYGSSATASIPANSILIFDISLLDVI